MIEIERKFLVADDSWRSAVAHKHHLRDGLITDGGDGKVRIRIAADVASITVKGPRKGFARMEYEYRIPLGDAEHMLNTVCAGRILEKTRYVVPYAGLAWEIDVYEGRLSGVILAEVELRTESEFVRLPSWIGCEVTGDPHYGKRALLKRLG